MQSAFDLEHLFLYFPESEVDMVEVSKKAAPQKFKVIDERLDALEQKIQTRWTPWYKRAGGWITRNWVLSVLIGLASIFGPYYLSHRDDGFNSRMDSRIDKVLKEPNGILQKLDAIQQQTTRTDATLATLQPFIQDILRREADRSAALPQADFDRALPAFSHAMAAARTQTALIPLNTIEKLNSKLLKANPASLAYWPATANLISLRSLAVASDANSLIKQDLPNCTDHDPIPPKVLSVQGKSFTASLYSYEDCKFTLDRQIDTDRVNAWATVHVSPLVFRHCLILYGGGPVHLVDHVEDRGFIIRLDRAPAPPYEMQYNGPVRIDNPIGFDSCLWILNVDNRPPERGAKIIRALLESKNLNIEVGAPA